MRKFQLKAMANEVSKSEDVGDGGVLPSIFRVITIQNRAGGSYTVILFSSSAVGTTL